MVCMSLRPRLLVKVGLCESIPWHHLYVKVRFRKSLPHTNFSPHSLSLLPLPLSLVSLPLPLSLSLFLDQYLFLPQIKKITYRGIVRSTWFRTSPKSPASIYCLVTLFSRSPLSFFFSRPCARVCDEDGGIGRPVD